MPSDTQATRGELITGTRAKWYNLRLPLWRYIRRGHLQNVQLKDGQSLLDVGFGTGTSLAALHERYGDAITLYGVEPSDDMLAQAKALFSNESNVHLKKVVAEKLPFDDAHFDYVICSLVMHHLPRATKKQALKEMRRVLKPGGVCIVSDWEKPTNIMGKMIGWLWRNHAYVKENTQGILPGLLKEVGFTKIETTHVQDGIVHHIKALK